MQPSQDIETLHQSVARLASNVENSDFLVEELRRFQELIAVASGNMVLGLFVNALHRISKSTEIEYDAKRCRAAVRGSEDVLRAIERGDSEEARLVTEKLLDAARRYRERTAPDLLKQPVAWIDSDH